MSSSPLVQESEFGIHWRYECFNAFFGNRHGNEIELKQKFSSLDFKKIKQVHGNHIVMASDTITEADGHFTSIASTALQIKTADCIPLFIFDLKQKNIMAVHAGWRGVANKISIVAVKSLVKLGGDPRFFKAVMGPHIKKTSFEVDAPVWVQLMDSIPIDYHQLNRQCYEMLSEKKYKVDLEKIVQLQLLSSQLTQDNIDSVSLDSVSDLRWHSHRRDKDQAGRNLSFNWRDD